VNISRSMFTQKERDRTPKLFVIV